MMEHKASTESSIGLTDHTADAIQGRLERTVCYGAPTCDACYHLAADDRPDDGEFWPGEMTIYINANGETAVDWKARTLCDYHDDAEDVPDEATHRVIATAEFIGREHRMNSAHEYVIEGVAEVSR